MDASVIVGSILIGWFIGTLTFFSGFLLGALVYNKPKKETK